MKYNQPIGGAANDPYVDGNPSLGIQGSAVPAKAIEHPQREILHVITTAGLVPSEADTTQLYQALTTLFSGVGRFVGIQVFSASGTYTPSVSATKFVAVLYGAGGGGGGGGGGTASGGNGGAGGNTTFTGFGLTLTAGGGPGGLGGDSVGDPPSSHGTATGGLLNIPGGGAAAGSGGGPSADQEEGRMGGFGGLVISPVTNKSAGTTGAIVVGAAGAAGAAGTGGGYAGQAGVQGWIVVIELT